MLERGSNPNEMESLAMLANKENYEKMIERNTNSTCKETEASDADPTVIIEQVSKEDPTECLTSTTVPDRTSDEVHSNKTDQHASSLVKTDAVNDEDREISDDVKVSRSPTEEGKEEAKIGNVNSEESEETDPKEINGNGVGSPEDSSDDAESLKVLEAGSGDEDGDNTSAEVPTSSQTLHRPVELCNAEEDDGRKDDEGDEDVADHGEAEAKEEDEEEEGVKAASSTTSATDTGMREPPNSDVSLTSDTEPTGRPESDMLEGACGSTPLPLEACPTPVTVRVENAVVVQVGNDNVYSSADTEGGENSSSLASGDACQGNATAVVYINNCDIVQVGNHNRINIQKVTPQENAFVTICSELDIDPEREDDIVEGLRHEDVRRRFAKKMVESFDVKCKIKGAKKKCILLELEVPTEEDRMKLLRMARDGTLQQVLLETFLPEFAAEGRAVNMNLAIGVRNPSQAMVEELQGAVASSDHEDVVLVKIPAVPSPLLSSKHPQPHSAEAEDGTEAGAEGGASKYPEGTAEGPTKEFLYEELPDNQHVASKATFKHLSDSEDSEDSASQDGATASVEVGMVHWEAAANLPREEFDVNFLTCDICQSIFHNPRVLPCLHTFCARCLERWRKGKSQFTCPTCRHQVSLAGTDVTSLPPDFRVNKMLDFRAKQSSEKGDIQCQMCESGARVAGSCGDCHFFLCKNCITAHSKTPALKDHHITMLEYCSQHTDQLMTFYCQPCAKLVCRNCTATEHRPGPNHNPQEVSNIQKKSRPLHAPVEMTDNTDLSTEEKIDQMKLGKSTRLLQDLGMTEDETEDLEKDEARAKLKRRIRDMRAMADVIGDVLGRRRPWQMEDTLQRAMSENKTKRERLTDICNSVLEFVDSMDDDDKQKMSDVFGQDLQVVLADVRTFLQDDDCPILVVGETSSGKSSLLNLLLGEDILPVSHMASTSTLCYVRYGEVKKATVYLKGNNPTAASREHIINLQHVDRTEEVKSYVHRWGRPDAEEVEKVVIEWPLKFLQGGICLVDAPGIMATKEMNEVVAGMLPSACAFIYVINSAIPLKPASSSGGYSERDVHRDGFQLLELYQRQTWEKTFGSSQSDLESTMFVCNKWDCVQHSGEEAVKNDYLRSLKSHFPELRDDQVFFHSCIKAVGPAGQLSPEFTRLLDGLDKLLPQSLQHKLELQFHRVHQVLSAASQYIRLKLHSAYGTQRERKEAVEGARRRFANFDSHAQEVLQTLDQMLRASMREAENHLSAFLGDEALRERVYQKILIDFPVVDSSEIGKARLTTAIADEVKSQLKSNPNSAFNQCIRDADIRLREEFQTRFGALLEQHSNVIETMLHTPRLPSTLQQLGHSFKVAFFQIAGVFSAAPYLSSPIWGTVALAEKMIRVVHPDIRCFINQVFDAMTKKEAIQSAVKEHLKRPIQYLEACKDAIPGLRRVDEQLIRDTATETRPEEEMRRIYEPRLDTISQLIEKLCGFYITDIKKHEFDLTIGKPSGWHLHREGAHGRVYLAQLSKDGGTFTAAVKIYKQFPSGETYADFVREEENLRRLKGEHVVKCFGTYRGDNDYEGYPCLGLVMEYCPRTLDAEMFQKRENNPAWWGDDPEKQAAAFSYTQNLAVQLCEGLKHIHDAGYMHLNLKLINILVSSEGVVKLAGLSSSKAENANDRSIEGTRFYTAPEVFARKKYNRSADIYSMGVILLEMWYGRTIYYSDDPAYQSQLQTALPLNMDQQLPLPSSWDGRAPPITEWRKLINDCLRRNPGLRPTAENCRDRIAAMSLPPGCRGTGGF